MRTYSLSHVGDVALSRSLNALTAQDRSLTAVTLAHLAEFDRRRLFVPAGFASMYAYCVGELRLSEDVAWKRIRVARAAREHPAILAAIADGSLHLAAVCLLAPHLTPANAAELLAAAAHRTKADVEALLAEWFPRTELLPLVQEIRAVAAVAAGAAGGERQPTVTHGSNQESPAPGRAVSVEGEEGTRSHDRDGDDSTSDALAAPETQAHASGPDDPAGPAPVPGRVVPSFDVSAARPKPEASATFASSVAPSAASRYAVQLNVSRQTYDKLKRAEALLSHVIPGGDIAEILDRALDSLITQLEKRKYATTANPRTHPAGPVASANARYIPAHIRRAVWERDGARCTFVSETGHRCEERKWLEFDHVDPVAFGGRPSIEGIRLRCRVHNQFEAERTFGAKFMNRRREEAQRARKGVPGGERAAADDEAP